MPAPTRQAVIGVGSNLGDRAAAIESALARLRQASDIKLVVPSAIFETQPVGVTDQPAFLNLVVGVETTLTPEALLETLLSVERTAGRRRENEMRWGPRVLDLDLLLFEGETRTGPGLELPHPRMWERAFVLAPLMDFFANASQFQGSSWDETRARMKKTTIFMDGVKRWRTAGKKLN